MSDSTRAKNTSEAYLLNPCDSPPTSIAIQKRRKRGSLNLSEPILSSEVSVVINSVGHHENKMATRSKYKHGELEQLGKKDAREGRPMSVDYREGKIMKGRKALVFGGAYKAARYTRQRI